MDKPHISYCQMSYLRIMWYLHIYKISQKLQQQIIIFNRPIYNLPIIVSINQLLYKNRVKKNHPLQIIFKLRFWVQNQRMLNLLFRKIKEAGNIQRMFGNLARKKNESIVNSVAD